jgi:hypothetical protein
VRERQLERRGTGSCTRAQDIVTCEPGNLGSGASAGVTIVVTPGRVGTFINSASITGLTPDSNQANNTDTEETTVTTRKDFVLVCIRTDVK